MARKAHAFHRFAHHPLCAAYEQELIVLGRSSRICKGCTLALVGLLCGAVTGIFVRLTGMSASIALVLALLLLLTSLRRRLPKVLNRGAAGALIGLALTQGVGAFVLGGAVLALAYQLYRLRGPDRGPCASCPENGNPSCSGFRPILEAERAFRQAASELLSRS